MHSLNLDLSSAEDVSELAGRMRRLRVKVDAAQVELTREVVDPLLPALLDSTRRHREAVDAEIHTEIEAGRAVRGAPRHEKYPIGWCGPICERIFCRLSDESDDS